MNARCSGDLGDRAERHEAILQIDHKMCSWPEIQALEYAQPDWSFASLG